jgi:hypothetical protein
MELPLMSKEKRRGNRELKKPKKPKPLAPTVTLAAGPRPSLSIPDASKKPR